MTRPAFPHLVVPEDTSAAAHQAQLVAEINRLQAGREANILRKLSEAGVDIAEYVACPIGKPGLRETYRKFAPDLARTIQAAKGIGERT